MKRPVPMARPGVGLGVGRGRGRDRVGKGLLVSRHNSAPSGVSSHADDSPRRHAVPVCLKSPECRAPNAAEQSPEQHAHGQTGCTTGGVVGLARLVIVIAETSWWWWCCGLPPCMHHGCLVVVDGA